MVIVCWVMYAGLQAQIILFVKSFHTFLNTNKYKLINSFWFALHCRKPQSRVYTAAHDECQPRQSAYFLLFSPKSSV